MKTRMEVRCFDWSDRKPTRGVHLRWTNSRLFIWYARKKTNGKQSIIFSVIKRSDKCLISLFYKLQMC